MEGYSNAVEAVAIVEPFSWGGAAFEAAWGITANVHVGQSGKDKSQHCSGEDDDWIGVSGELNFEA
jgi:hypothetical protein